MNNMQRVISQKVYSCRNETTLLSLLIAQIPLGTLLLGTVSFSFTRFLTAKGLTAALRGVWTTGAADISGEPRRAEDAVPMVTGLASDAPEESVPWGIKPVAVTPAVL